MGQWPDEVSRRVRAYCFGAKQAGQVRIGISDRGVPVTELLDLEFLVGLFEAFHAALGPWLQFIKELAVKAESGPQAVDALGRVIPVRDSLHFSN
eukprot:NODE_1613_length_1357_cov_6.733180_g1337_i0.p5 GENE.NODE_1613_length_1357_cov_6.733180_g1337_i0~~NODE_1613_length_1357_cov_6.733180_g1337_i0.p5  ORF type:complete len:95 (-),score=15.26 NODE_1613_length_1357_cov_6.733180_g1337_i0:361-645(-)